MIDPSASPWTELTAEVLDPLSDGLNAGDPAIANAAVVRAGGLLHVDNARRTQLRAEPRAAAKRDVRRRRIGDAVRGRETRTRETCCRFSGFSDGVAHVTFGLRDYWGGRNFLLRLSVNGRDLTKNPEPASMVLLGTGFSD